MKSKIAVAATLVFMMVTAGCASNNAKQSFDADKIKKTVATKCPYQSTNPGDWQVFNPDNVCGFTAIHTESDETTTTVILGFYDNSKIVRHLDVIKEKVYAKGESGDDFFDIVDGQAQSKGKYYFYKFSYDNSIEYTGVFFDKTDARCIIETANGGNLIYCDFSDRDVVTRIYQDYDETGNVWVTQYETEPWQMWY